MQGGLPDVHNLDDAGNLRHTITFQCYYASVIAPFFGVDTRGLAPGSYIYTIEAGGRSGVGRMTVVR